jgi:hypothetical protein
VSLPRTQEPSPASLTHTGAVVGPQLEARFALAAKGARQVHTAVLAVAVAALVYVYDRGRGRTEHQLGLTASAPMVLSLPEELNWVWARSVMTCPPPTHSPLCPMIGEHR